MGLVISIMTQGTFVYWINDVQHVVPINSISLPAGLSFCPGGIRVSVRTEGCGSKAEGGLEPERCR